MSAYDEMPAGPEMDRLVAEKVMGNAELADQGCWENDKTYVSWSWMPSSNISAAWEVVEKLRPTLWALVEETHTIEQPLWRAEFMQREGRPSRIWSSEADAAPLAICRAALKAVEAQP